MRQVFNARFLLSWLSPILLLPLSLAIVPPPAPLLASPLIADGGSWLADWLRKKPTQRSVVRGDQICAVAPGLLESTPTIWSDRPVFIWQGTGQEIRVRDRETQALLWSKSVSATDQAIVYDGEPLQMGRLYQWQVVEDATPPTAPSWNTFEVMSVEQRVPITTELDAIETRMMDESLGTIALAKSNYLAEQGLWSDALRMLYEVRLSPDIQMERQKVIEEICPAVVPAGGST
jgi:Domain of Unknown Function (DUF928)